MAISTRSDAFSIKKESSEGVPAAPTAATDFIALQDDLTITPSFEILENAERLASLGAAKSSLGLENPAASTSHYWRASGVEGQCPNYGPLVESCLGSEISGLTERAVVSATTTTIEVGPGEGVEFPVGRPLLIKDPVNGYSSRYVTSVTGDVITLSFPLNTAPGAGVLLGNPCYYAPANDGHPTLTFWHYIGNKSNGGAVQSVAGTRVLSMDVSADAGQFINASYSGEGTEYFYDPRTNTASEVSIDFTSDNGTFVATIAADNYKDPIDVAEAVEAALNAADPAETYTCTYNGTTGTYTLATTTSAVFDLPFASGANVATSAAQFIGFSATDISGAQSYESQTPLDFSAPFTPVFDDADPIVAKDNELMMNVGDSNVCIDASSVGYSVSLEKADITSVCARSGKSGTIPSGRSVEITLTALLKDYDAADFHNFHTNATVRFQWTAGTKLASNWVAGKTVSAFAQSATITSYEIQPVDNLATLSMTLQTFVNSDGDGEFYIGQL